MIDKEIIKKCIENNKASQKALYEAYYSKMMGVCLRYSGGEEEAHEMVNEGFFKVYKNLKNYKDTEVLDFWIKKNMIEACIKYIRVDKNERSIVSTIHANKLSKEKPPEMNDADILAKAKQIDFLKAIQELTSGFRIVFNLFLIDGYSHKEIAEMLDVSEETSKTNYEKARYSFRKNLVQHLSNSYGK